MEPDMNSVLASIDKAKEKYGEGVISILSALIKCAAFNLFCIPYVLDPNLFYEKTEDGMEIIACAAANENFNAKWTRKIMEGKVVLTCEYIPPECGAFIVTVESYDK